MSLFSSDNKILRGGDLAASEITPRASFDQRRLLIRAAALGLAPAALLAASAPALARPPSSGARQLVAGSPPDYQLAEKLTPYESVTSYNNFYEYGVHKSDPSSYAGRLKTHPWQVSVEGLVAKPRVFDIDELLKLAPLEERIYRMRCVEGWSMVIPWIGYPLMELIRRVEPLGSAKYVEFVTLNDPAQMPGLGYNILSWPYVEGLRLDEAMHPLTLLTLGLYGEVLPKQNGAPVRIVTPWKYGFKSAKSIVKIRFVEDQPLTSWQRSAPHEYGFYAIVNPDKPHLRWSQATERRLGDGDGGFGALLHPKRKTLLFNGYPQVASLYGNMELGRLL